MFCYGIVTLFFFVYVFLDISSMFGSVGLNVLVTSGRTVNYLVTSDVIGSNMYRTVSEPEIKIIRSVPFSTVLK